MDIFTRLSLAISSQEDPDGVSSIEFYFKLSLPKLSQKKSQSICDMIFVNVSCFVDDKDKSQDKMKLYKRSQ